MSSKIIHEIIKQQTLKQVSMPRVAVSNLARNRSARVSGSIKTTIPMKQTGDFVFDVLGMAAVASTVAAYAVSQQDLLNFTANKQTAADKETPQVHVRILRSAFLSVDVGIEKSMELAAKVKDQSLSAYESLPSLQTVTLGAGGLGLMALSIRKRRNIIDGLYLAKRLYGNTPSGTFKKIAIGSPLVAISIPVGLALKDVISDESDSDNVRIKLFKTIFHISNQMYDLLKAPGNAFVLEMKKLLEN